MELRTLRAFVEVVRQGGFSSAAKVVFATQSTVSKAVKQLEDELDLRLLERAGHRATLTAAGELVYRRALKMLAERDDLVAELDELRGLGRGTLRLGLPPIGSDTLFAPLFAVYRGRYPGIDIRLVEHGSKRLEEMVLAGELELAASLLPVSAELEYQALRREPIVALISSAHDLAKRDRVDLAELTRLEFILFGEGFALDSIILGACRERGLAPTVAARSSQIAFVLELVASGLGVGFLPKVTADQRPHPNVRQLAVSAPGFDWHVALIWRRGAYLSHAARAWLALASEGTRKTRRPNT